ncbi:hypothetical protein OQI87_05250 [Lactobacillus kefiranofaciens]|uniref:hypothetical protein n=1 Tax=Lactobacillus kefiranofaciens TaxID=267818 RepID=UPI002469408D|nr:hypothetical protein [Lactobacillus kefiranofaciens]MDH5100543.1 hypothetical protein [Lactobacillus kefiranofaciens]
MSRKNNLINIKPCYSNTTARSFIPQGSANSSSQQHNLIPKLSTFTIEHTIDKLANLAKTYKFSSAGAQAVWFLTQSPDLTTEVLHNNADVIKHLAFKINQQVDNSKPISHKQLVMIAETQFLYHVFSENGLSNQNWTHILKGLNENIEQSV